LEDTVMKITGYPVTLRLPHLPERLLSFLALGDVPHQNTHHLLGTEVDHARVDLDVDERAVLPSILSLPDEELSLCEDSLEVRVHFLTGVGDEVVDLHLSYLLRGVAQHLPESRVSLHDAPVLSVQDVDAVGSLLDHRPVTFPTLHEILLSLLSLDALGHPISHGGKRLEGVLRERVPGEQRHHPYHSALDDEGITGEGHHAFPLRPFLVVNAGIAQDVVGQVRLPLLSD
jgi:hypothetical protein